MLFLDFFSGIGGFRLGMELAGHRCVGHCEKDKYAEKSYREMHDIKEGEWFAEDITKVRAEELPRADVWCFGFPCQDISIAGRKEGFNGDRSSLFFAVTRLIRETNEEDRPKYLFIENVRNLFSVNQGFDFLKLQIELAQIGYDCEWELLNSKDFGVPQNRERVYIIGHLRGRSTRKVFPITRSYKSIIVPGIACGDFRYDKGLRIRENGVSPCLCARNSKMNNHNDLSSSIFVIGNINPSKKGMGGRVIDSNGIAPTLTTNKGVGMNILVREATKKGYSVAEHGDSINLEYINSNDKRGRVGKSRVNTLTTSCKHGVVLNGRVRRLTPRECFRLQGWPDEYFDRAASVCSDSQLYKQAGNGVTVNVIYEIAKKL
ncbi:DNA cytosine methyltransferase [Clostridium sp. DSM 100503]|uniref:DNA cytosine methyltransferase n=1 Tax=Clostridium sp. DSM 100503 TaxID=2963282 RepID=UPI00214A7BE3|nr:DNA cytosine methyltransferase [Clostridium sp. DSM 100503]MCR1952735.1 DNA cytosine methyltransferase [Clostridium sp. DSM 100503]